MATKEMAAMLDELMGRNRNARPGDKIENLTWDDASVCKYFLVDICPHELFVNTKDDLGTCLRIHDDAVKKEFRRVKDYSLKIPIVNEYIRYVGKLLSNLAAKIKRGKDRLELSQMEQAATVTQGLSKKQQEEIETKIIILTEKINNLVDEAEKAGVQGDVEKATGLLNLVDTLREERNQLKAQIGMKNPSAATTVQDAIPGAQSKFEVCEVCGCLLPVGVDGSRLDDHLMGKLHVGYARLKGSLERTVAEHRKRKEERRTEEKESKEVGKASSERETGEISPDHEKASAADEEDRRRSKKRKSDKERSRRSRSRDDRRRRSRSREQRRRSKSRDHHHRRRSRSRDRRRDRSRDRRHM